MVSEYQGWAWVSMFCFCQPLPVSLQGGLNPQASRNDVRILCICYLYLPVQTGRPCLRGPRARGLGECIREGGLTLVALDGEHPPSKASWAQPGPLPIQPPLQSSFNFLFL